MRAQDGAPSALVSARGRILGTHRLNDTDFGEIVFAGLATGTFDAHASQQTPVS